MKHDFEENDQQNDDCRSTEEESCCTGFMDYETVDEDGETFLPPREWSSCSVQDFRRTYVKRDWRNNCFTSEILF